MQEDVGLQCITDGEFRRGSWFFGFVQAVEGLTTRDSLFDFQDADGGHSTFQTAYVKDKLRRTRGITTDEFSYRHAPTLRAPRRSPCRHRAWCISFGSNDAVSPAAYPEADDFWPDLIAVYREELAALGRSAAPMCNSTKCLARCCAIRKFERR